MSDTENDVRTPWHLWVVGVVSLLWNGGGGGYDYVMSKTLDPGYIDLMSSTMGLDPQVIVAYFEAFPLWMNIFWAIGVWGAVLGSILLLLRRRLAIHAFVASLVGIAVSTYYQFANPFPGEVDTVIPAVMAFVVPAIIIALIYYAKRMSAAGVLR